jgi:hypothetical protein
MIMASMIEASTMARLAGGWTAVSVLKAGGLSF